MSPTQLQDGTSTQLQVHVAPAGMGDPQGRVKVRPSMSSSIPFSPGGTVPSRGGTVVVVVVLVVVVVVVVVVVLVVLVVVAARDGDVTVM